MNKILLSLSNSVNEGVFSNTNTRRVQLVTRRFDSRSSKIKPKLRPKSNSTEEVKEKAWTHKIRIVIGLAIFATWFTYIGGDLIKTGYKYFQEYQSNQIMPDKPSFEIVEFKLPFSRGSKKKEIDSDNEI